MKLTANNIYRLCNKEQYFTDGSIEQYNKMFELVEEGSPLHDIALAIWICSEDVLLDDVETQLEALLDSPLF